MTNLHNNASSTLMTFLSDNNNCVPTNTDRARTLRGAPEVTPVAGLILLLSIFVSSLCIRKSSALQTEPTADVASASVERLARMGVMPDALAASGGSATDLSDAFALLAAKQSDLDAAALLDSALSDAQRTARVRQRELWLGGPDDERSATLTAARTDLESKHATAERAQRALAEPVRELLAARLGADGFAAMDRFNDNAKRRVPNRFRGLTLSDGAWRTLESASSKSKHNAALNTAEASLLSQCENHPQTVLIASRLANAAPAIEAALSDAISTALAARP